jgi:hypothetical protein
VIPAPEEESGDEILGRVVEGIGDEPTACRAGMADLQGEFPTVSECVEETIVDCVAPNAEIPEFSAPSLLRGPGIGGVEEEIEEFIEERLDLLLS